jgi:hypothetical protein
MSSMVHHTSTPSTSLRWRRSGNADSSSSGTGREPSISRWVPESECSTRTRRPPPTSNWPMVGRLTRPCHTGTSAVADTPAPMAAAAATEPR